MMAMGTQGEARRSAVPRLGLESRIGSEAQAQIAAVRSDIEAERKKLEPYYPFVHGVKDLPDAKDLPLAIRGNPETLGDPVPRHFLSVLSESEPKPFTKGSGRLELAEEILKQPLAMRVAVNRIWRGHFGTGIVDTPSNFGTTGERPTNPELLEYLASAFVKNGMSMKKLHREIMLSSVYQLSTDKNEAAFAKDSGNRLYWRGNAKRLDAEQLRDSVLFVAGNLDKSLGGPSADLTPAIKRRTVYGKVSRYKLDEYLQLFDFPNPNISAEKRFTTTVPLQRLFLMNSDFMQVQAEELAKRVAAEPDNRTRIKKLYQIAFGRDPNEGEIDLGIEYLKTEPLLEYEEGKKKAEEEDKKKGGRGRGPGKKEDAAPKTPDTVSDSKDTPPTPAVAAKTAMPADDAGAGQTEEMPAPAAMPMETAPMGMGMMGGVMPGAMPGGRRGPGGPGAAEVKYDPTAWGRYAKVLLSSSEFLYIN